ncbi:protein tweety homolog 2-like [Dendronephthya gigantea]|uniref:protein tweety homolog 2-like n=1 Tax=Dendronephthya gigantea TaxID=151771 RepID=UPI00106B9B33|nr:protein tweety homolog 2-like [Dendronephthya gigantea]
MALLLKYKYEGPYHASDLAKWFHSSPHKDLQLDDTTTIFTPSDQNYLQALYVLAIFISSFGVLIFLLILMYYTCCFCICRKRKRTSDKQSSCCSKGCLQLLVFILALICCGALVVGFFFNENISDGVDQFRNSCSNIQDDINAAFNSGQNIEKHLSSANSTIQHYFPEPQHYEAIEFINQLKNDLSLVKSVLPQNVVNKSCNAADKVHHYDNYRWLGTVILLSWCILFCIFLFWIACEANRCILVVVAISCLLTVLCAMAVVGVDFGIATGMGDFCVHPNKAIQKVDSGKSKYVISYYLKCDEKSTYGPFDQYFEDLNGTLERLIILIGKTPVEEEIKDLILNNLNNTKNDLPFFEAKFACRGIHKEYMKAMDGLCGTALNSLGVVILSVFIIAIFSGLLSCFVCPLWKQSRPSPTMYNDIRGSQDDVGNAVLWWPHDVDAESEQSFYQRHGERTPLLVERPHTNYESRDHPNENIVQVDYYGGETRVDEYERQSNINNRHSF